MAAALLESLHGSRGFAVSKYHDDYDAIRVKSVRGGSQFSFVNTEQPVYDLWDAHRMRRPFLRMNLLLGEVDYVSDNTLCELGDTAQETICIRLRPPAGATCEILRLYAEQLNRMRDILVSDARDTIGCTAISWFNAAAICAEWVEKCGCFYVLVPGRVVSRSIRAVDLKPGARLVLTANMERVDMDTVNGVDRQYYMLITSFRAVDDNEIPSKGPGYACDSLSTAGWFIGAQYHRDYEAIRVRDLVGGSMFCFVDTEEPVYRLGSELRQRHPMRMDLFVGEVDYVSDVTPCTFGGETARGMICIRIKAPTNATCEVLHIYAEQVKRLEEILASDAREMDNTTTASWFDIGAVSRSWARKPGCIYFVAYDWVKSRTERIMAFKPGTTISVIASAERVDMDIEGRIDSRYYMLLNNIRVADRMDVPQKGPGYVCDRLGSAGCEYCKYFLLLVMEKRRKAGADGGSEQW
ncbi:hypothetical protein DFH06DRAFT_1121433 [Mycena polygramma]|nr:hypothetical protein DFH06DRAFT_1121433 [Mycena polygramma]